MKLLWLVDCPSSHHSRSQPLSNSSMTRLVSYASPLVSFLIDIDTPTNFCKPLFPQCPAL